MFSPEALQVKAASALQTPPSVNSAGGDALGNGLATLGRSPRPQSRASVIWASARPGDKPLGAQESALDGAHRTFKNRTVALVEESWIGKVLGYVCMSVTSTQNELLDCRSPLANRSGHTLTDLRAIQRAAPTIRVPV